jgi:DNA-binding GntR family transcriptional regulator
MLVQNSLVFLADQEIRTLILTGELLPGQRLVEARLCERLGISRPPLREALRMLAVRGVLEQSPRHGYRVVELGARDIDEIYGLRARLELFALEVAVPTLTDDDLAPLDKIMVDMWQAARALDELGLFVANREFHLALVELADHRRISQAYETLIDQMQLCMVNNLRAEALATGAFFEGCRRHEQLLDSVRSGALAEIRAALARHGARAFLTEDGRSREPAGSRPPDPRPPDPRRPLAPGRRERVGGSAAAGDPRIGQRGGERVLSAPARAVPRGEQRRREGRELRHGVTDDRLECRAAQVEPADQGVQAGDPGQSAGVANDVDHPGVTATGEDHQAPVAQVDDQGLVVEHQGIVFPP